MNAEVTRFDEAWARRITERIRYSAIGVRDGLEKLQSLMAEAQDGNAHELLGYASWTAYISEVMGEEPLRLARDERRDLVAWLSGQGMSTRAIAPIVGVSKSQVAADIEVSRTGQVEDAPASFQPRTAFTVVDGMKVDPATGEVFDSPTIEPAPVVEEHTITEKVKTVTGLDGKEYRQKPRDPKPVPSGDEANRLNAIQASKAIGSALTTLLGFTVPEYRNNIITEWWPIGKNDVPPDQVELFTPSQLRHIAQGLTTTANEMEAHRV